MILSLKAIKNRITQNHFRTLIGLAGIDKNESYYVTQIGGYLEWLMLLIVIWLPFQWYFRAHHIISPTTAIIDSWVIWSAFVAETTILTLLVQNKKNYLFTNWLNLAIILVGFPLLWDYLPVIADFQVIFLLVIIAIVVPWLATARKFLIRNHLGTTLLVFTMTTILAGLLITFAESTIQHPIQGIWWAFQTVTTIGYGDTVPTTLLGRTIAVVVMLLGIGLFSLLTANFSAFLIERDEKKQFRELEEIKASLHEITTKINELDNEFQSIYYDYHDKNKLH